MYVTSVKFYGGNGFLFKCHFCVDLEVFGGYLVDKLSTKYPPVSGKLSPLLKFT
jgi:hypothetical protein